MKTKTLSILVSISILGAAFAVDVRDVTLQQRWPWSRLIDVEFVIDGEAGGNMRYDVALEAKNGSDVLAVPTAAITGSLSALENGLHKITIDPVAAGFPNDVLTHFTVTLSATPSPSYMIINLVTGAKTYRYDWSDTTWCNTDEYKTTNMVFRHICKGAFYLGAADTNSPFLLPSDPKNHNDMPAHRVHVSSDFYIAVFETTQKQYETLMGDNPSTWAHEDTRPVETVPLISKMRWCTYPSALNSTQFSSEALDTRGFTGKLSNLASVKADLPWEYQWEYAARAGTQWPYFMENVYQNNSAEMVKYMRYRGNCPNTTDTTLGSASGGTATVGAYLPNAWGLYDVCGNVFEACLDGYLSTFDASMPEATDEFVAMNLGYSKRVFKGGGYNSDHKWTRCATRADVSGDNSNKESGFRVVVKYE